MKVIRISNRTDKLDEKWLKVKSLLKGATLGFDLETDNTDKDLAHVSVVQVYIKDMDLSILFYIKIEDAYLPEPILNELLDIYKSMTIIGHNLYYDISMMYKDFGVLPKGVAEDTYVLAQMRAWPVKKLKDLALEADPSLEGKLRKFDELMNLTFENEKNKSGIALTYHYDDMRETSYMAYDPYLPFIVKSYLWRDDLADAYKTEMGIIPQLAVMTIDGLNVDTQKYRESVAYLSNEKDKLQMRLDSLLGYPIKVNSSAQVRRALFEDLGLPIPPIKTDKGEISTSEEALKYLEGNEIVDTILELKHMQSICSAADKVPGYLDVYGKIHPEFRPIGIDSTSRIYTSNPSLNQWPWELRECIVPRPGYKFVHADWKAAELFIACYLAGQQNILDVFNEGKDVHSYLSGRLLGVDKPSKEQRDISKVLTFATMYGSEGAAVSRSLRCSEDSAKMLVNQYLTILDKVKDLRDAAQNQAEATGITRTITGRPRVLSKFNDPRTIAEARRQAFNTMIQGSCADLQKMAIAKVYNKYFDDVKLKFTVFDSFLLEVPEEMSNEKIEEILNYMSDFSDFKLGLKLGYKYGIGYNWKEANDLC